MLLLVMLSCSERTRISRELAKFMSRDIVLPACFQEVESGVLSMSKAKEDMPVMIFYSDSLSCSLCQINYLHERKPIYELADSLGTFVVMTILSPGAEEYGDVVDALRRRNLDFPVYLDYDRRFARQNLHIPSDVRFHSFLIGRDGKPIFVGDPIAGDALWNLFCKVLDEMNTEKP